YLHDIARSLAPKFKGRNVTVDISCSQEIIFTSYPGAFAQIFTNFIVNSLMHAYSETDTGTIRISVNENDSDFTFVYSDDGKGIPKENQPKVFEAFFTTNTQEGTGLGMNITYNLVTQKLGGDIQLWSEEGKGVIFTIIIPKSNILA
ncbi:MAG TPA: HAMP domain-containing sensor histidine kinase, partial [Bacteroidales bacterium]|nr:HAMP domain-containing sensor histidine kinase [Bacteroidales bacterium]